MQYVVIRRQEIGQTPGLIGRSARDAVDAVGKQLPLHVHLFRQPVGRIHPDHAEGGRNGRQISRGLDHPARAQVPVDEMDAIQKTVGRLAIDRDRIAIGQELGHALLDRLLLPDRDHVAPFQAQVQPPLSQVARTHHDLLPDLERFDVQVGRHRRPVLTPQIPVLEL